jgi:hypothetical protein
MLNDEAFPASCFIPQSQIRNPQLDGDPRSTDLTMLTALVLAGDPEGV